MTWVRSIAGHVHLVERLHGREPGGAARRARFCRLARSVMAVNAGSPKRNAARAASARGRRGRVAALVAPLDARPRQACSRLSKVRMPLPIGTA